MKRVSKIGDVAAKKSLSVCVKKVFPSIATTSLRKMKPGAILPKAHILLSVADTQL